MQSAGALGDGDEHIATAQIVITYNNAIFFNVPGAGGEESVVGQTSGLSANTDAQVTGPKAGQYTLTVKDIASNDPNFLFTVAETLQGQTSGGEATILSVTYDNFVRNEGE